MHVLLIHQAFAALDEPGGTRHHELARFLAQRGHRVTVIASPVSYLTGKTRSALESASPDPEQPGVTILRTYTYSALHRSFIHRVFSFLSFMLSSFWAGMQVPQVDLVWGTSPPIFQGLTAWALARLKRKPLLFEVRDLWPDFAIQVGVLKNPLLIRLSYWLERFLYRRADQLIVNSPGFVEHIQERGGRDVRVIPNGVDPAMFDPPAAGLGLRQAHGLLDKFIVMYAGAHGMSNDLAVALEAARLLQEEPDIVIVLVGDGKEKPALMAKSAALGLRNVIFLPPVAKTGMAETLAAADACLAILKPIPMYATVFPNKVFDYMAASRPVLLAIDGVIRQVVEEADCGIFIPPGNPAALAAGVRRLAEDRAWARAMGARGRLCVEQKFDRTKLAESLAELIEGMR
ncbi:MAG: glycosyltransferase WbuB [Anaerolineae bacterium UTCFX2]|jgi:glycosyltransferase involved in cell wall biosynthesis|nr:glycosyltransferase family 4 protein [Anaerolineales bacterium]OQY90962.1 MAG: glycosyltransferase WbuB [Anaerolineae bacterium UTCFX2]